MRVLVVLLILLLAGCTAPEPQENTTMALPVEVPDVLYLHSLGAQRWADTEPSRTKTEVRETVNLFLNREIINFDLRVPVTTSLRDEPWIVELNFEMENVNVFAFFQQDGAAFSEQQLMSGSTLLLEGPRAIGPDDTLELFLRIEHASGTSGSFTLQTDGTSLMRLPVVQDEQAGIRVDQRGGQVVVTKTLPSVQDPRVTIGSAQILVEQGAVKLERGANFRIQTTLEATADNEAAARRAVESAQVRFEDLGRGEVLDFAYTISSDTPTKATPLTTITIPRGNLDALLYDADGGLLEVADLTIREATVELGTGGIDFDNGRIDRLAITLGDGAIVFDRVFVGVLVNQVEKGSLSGSLGGLSTGDWFTRLDSGTVSLQLLSPNRIGYDLIGDTVNGQLRFNVPSTVLVEDPKHDLHYVSNHYAQADIKIDARWELGAGQVSLS